MATVLPEMETIENIRTLESRVSGTTEQTGLPELIRKAVNQGVEIPRQIISEAAINELLRKGQLTQSSAELLRQYTGDADPTVTGSALSGGEPVTESGKVSGDPSLSEALTGQETPIGTTVEAVGEAASPGTTADISGDAGDLQRGPGADIDVVGTDTGSGDVRVSGGSGLPFGGLEFGAGAIVLVVLGGLYWLLSRY